jgi:hypothetical protein
MLLLRARVRRLISDVTDYSLLVHRRHCATSPRQVFALIDSDGSGMLSMDEIKEAVRTVPPFVPRMGALRHAFGDTGTALPEKVGIFFHPSFRNVVPISPSASYL